ncbi:Crp/Fnr family transcriptional regulator [soil metagenome]
MATKPAPCLDCGIRDIAVCTDIGGDALAALSAIGRRRRLNAGQALAWAGDANLTCASLVSGILKVTASSVGGREQIVGLLYPGDFVGQPFIDESTLTVTALSASELCVYPRERFERLLVDFPRLGHSLLRRTMNSLNDARERVLTLGQRSASERLAAFLLDMADRAHANGTNEDFFEIPISRSDLADFLGMTIETVSRQLARFRSAGAIAIGWGDRRIVLRDRLALERAAEPD